MRRSGLQRWVGQALGEVFVARWPVLDQPNPPAWPDAAYCSRCGVTLGPGQRNDPPCPACVKQSIAWDAVVRLTEYNDTIEPWLAAMKFARRWRFGPWFGKQLGRAILERHTQADDSTPIICPVPLALWRRWHRGFNQARLIADGIAEVTGWPVVELLKRTRGGFPQTTVPHTQRAANVRDAFAARRRCDAAGCAVWLVDDVKTTGATANRCAKLLRAAGATRVNLAVTAVARTEGIDFSKI
jgi:ComF family protein